MILCRDKNFYKSAARLTGFIALQNVIVCFVGLADNVMIGAYSQDALSGVALALMRPLAKRFLTPGYSATNVDRVIGSTTVVIQEIDNLKGQGQVKIADLEWSARSENGEIIPAGTEVTVLRIEGVKVFVKKKEE